MSSGFYCNNIYHLAIETQHETHYYTVTQLMYASAHEWKETLLMNMRSAGFERPRELDMHVTYSIILITLTMIYIA
jgi:hypothetical protein